MEWLDPLLWVENYYGQCDSNVEVLKSLQLAMRLEPPLNWSNGGQSAIGSLKRRIGEDREFALDALDFFVQKVAESSYADELGEVLTLGGSVWEVAHISESERHLAKRVIGPVRNSIDALHDVSPRAHHHLSTAWQKLVGRNPDPSAAYREAVRAVEAAAKPVVAPKDPTATLGKMIRALRDKPEKWVVALHAPTPIQIADMADLLWKGQQDRHGTDDEGAALNVSQEEADSAVYLALSLSRIFANGGIRVA